MFQIELEITAVAWVRGIIVGFRHEDDITAWDILDDVAIVESDSVLVLPWL